MSDIQTIDPNCHPMMKFMSELGVKITYKRLFGTTPPISMRGKCPNGRCKIGMKPMCQDCKLDAVRFTVHMKPKFSKSSAVKKTSFQSVVYFRPRNYLNHIIHSEDAHRTLFCSLMFLCVPSDGEFTLEDVGLNRVMLGRSHTPDDFGMGDMPFSIETRNRIEEAFEHDEVFLSYVGRRNRGRSFIREFDNLLNLFEKCRQDSLQLEEYLKSEFESADSAMINSLYDELNESCDEDEFTQYWVSVLSEE